MTQPDKPRCETCRYWGGRVSGRLYDPGHCRRYPPSVSKLGRDTWPTTAIADWCGEYQETPDAR